jgi:hypothetical protein
MTWQIGNGVLQANRQHMWYGGNRGSVPKMLKEPAEQRRLDQTRRAIDFIRQAADHLYRAGIPADVFRQALREVSERTRAAA